MSDLRDPEDEDDDPYDPDAPTKLRRAPVDTPRSVRVHPKFDPRKVPTLRRFRVRAEDDGDLEAPGLAARRGVELAHVQVFIALVLLALAAAIAVRLG